MPNRFLRFAISFAPFAVIAACAAESADVTPSPSSGGQAGADAAPDSSGGALDASSETSFDVFQPPEDTGLGDGCASAVAEGELVPLDMLILLDRSGSMTTNAKWDSARTAIKGFADSVSGAVNLGLTYFPATGGDDCNDVSYHTPDVAILPLPDNASAIKASLQAATTTGATPMRPAVEGSLFSVQSQLAANPLHQGILVLVTDGDPGGCTANTITDVAATAGISLAATPSIRTFVVGMEGANFTNLDKVATAGGTVSSFDVGTGAGATQALVQALQKIRSESLSCEYVLPVPELGKLDFDSVEVRFFEGGDAGTTKTFTKVASADDCTSTSFYYDDPEKPTKIILCADACTDVKTADLDAKVDIVLGCILNIPR
jgi:Mg-chelatase subunit ChlD